MALARWPLADRRRNGALHTESPGMRCGAAMSFTAPVHAALKGLRFSDPAIQDIFNYYSDHHAGVPGAPDLLSLTADDADAVAHLDRKSVV